MTIAISTSAPPVKSTPAEPLLRRVTSSGRFIPEIDGLRFIAIAAVFLLHDLGQVMAKNGIGVDARRNLDFASLGATDRALATTVIAAGGFGVHLFFVISGFILGLPFAEHYLAHGKKPSLQAYFLRRITRLEPPFILCLVLHAIAVWAMLGISGAEVLRRLGASVLYLHTQIYNEPSLINGVAWSLEVEVQFYLIAPLLALTFAIKSPIARRILLLAVIFVVGILNTLFGPETWRYRASIAFAVQYFLTGFLLADLFITHPALFARRHFLWDLIFLIVGIAITASLVAGGGPWGTLTFYLPLLLLVVFIAAFRSVLIRRLLTLRPIYLIGGMCYTLYLYHDTLITVLAIPLRAIYWHGAPLWINTLAQIPVQAAIVILLCLPFYIFVERPCMKRDWPIRLWTKFITLAFSRR